MEARDYFITKEQVDAVGISIDQAFTVQCHDGHWVAHSEDGFVKATFGGGPAVYYVIVFRKERGEYERVASQLGTIQEVLRVAFNYVRSYK